MTGIIIGAVAAVVLVIVIVAILLSKDSRYTPRGPAARPTAHVTPFIQEHEFAGMIGEEAAVRVIKTVLRADDRLFTNVSIEYDGKKAELDNVIVNRFGVFIIEVKNYKGRLVGGEDDFMWRKYKMTDAGNTYESSVKNPIKQVRRQVYVLAKYLEYYGIRVWVRGYAILLHGNSPVASDCLLRSKADIDRAVHTRDRAVLNADTIGKITKLLSGKQ